MPKLECVKNGRPLVTLMQGGNRFCRSVRIVGEILCDSRFAVETDHGDKMPHLTDDGIELGPKIFVVVQMPRALPAGLHNDDQRQRLRIRISLQMQALPHAVICEDEIVGGERKDSPAGFGFHQGGDEHDSGDGANSIF